MRILIITFLCFFLTACLDDLEPDDPTNANYNWPAYLYGYEIGFTVQSASGASVPVGTTIIYYYNTGGSVTGRNPVSGVDYYPNSYTYSGSSSSSVNIKLNYLDSFGNTGLEDFTLYPDSCTNGDYDLSTYSNGTLVGSSSGSFSILGGGDAC